MKYISMINDITLQHIFLKTISICLVEKKKAKFEDIVSFAAKGRFKSNMMVKNGF